MIRLLVFLAIVLPALAHAQTPLESTIGVGAHPLTNSVAAMWFIESKTEATKRLAAIVYFVGEPGWTEQATDWKSELGDPWLFYFKVAGSEILVNYHPSSRRLSVLSYNEPVSTANVLVVRGVGQSPLRVAYAEQANLDFAASENPSLALVRRSAALRAELAKP
jgi:hypothetical protein